MRERRLHRRFQAIAERCDVVGPAFHTCVFDGAGQLAERSEAEALVETNGGRILSSVSANLNYLVAGEEAGSKLEKAKKITSIKIITESEFLSLIHH